MLEKEIEKKVCSYAKSRGWLNYKFVSPSCRGVPDRIFIKKGRVFFIEFKSGKNNCTPLQLSRIQELTSHNMDVFIVNTIGLGKSLIDNYDNYIDD